MKFPHITYDIKHKLIRAETSTLHHKNTPHTGDRYCIVLFNKDLNYAGSDVCERSCAIKAQPPVETSYLRVKDDILVEQYRKELLCLLSDTKFPKDRCSAQTKTHTHSKYGTNDTQVISFGVTASRKSREEREALGMYTRKSYNQNNTKYGKLYHAFNQYINALYPHIFGEVGIYHACIIAKNSQCEWHTDKCNIGHASLTALGSYTAGGELLVEAPPVKNDIDYTIVIPTYKRANTFYKKTYSRIIKPYNLEAKVLLLIQSDEDAEEYEQRTPELQQLRTPSGLLNTMNFISNYYPVDKPIVVMHDDLTRLLYVEPPSTKRINVSNAHVLFQQMFNSMRTHECNLGGFYPTDHPLTMSQQQPITTDLRFIHDPLTFMYNKKIMIRTDFTHHKMDFQRTIEYYKLDGKVLRYNHHAFCTAYNPKTNEGGFGYRSAEEEKEVCEMFVKEYGKYISRVVKHKNGSTSLVLRKNP